MSAGQQEVFLGDHELPVGAPIGSIEGVVFDMDGTLIDSECHVHTVVEQLLQDRGVTAPGLDYSALYGITWDAIAQVVVSTVGALTVADVSRELQERFGQILLEGNTPLIPGAEAFLRTCCERLPTAICTSGNRESLDHLLQRLSLGRGLDAAVTAEDVQRSKPDPEGYLLAAARLGVPANRCLGFEDSIAGLRAVRAAGMAAIAITYRSPDREQALALSDRAVVDFTELAPDFLARVRQG